MAEWRRTLATQIERGEPVKATVPPYQAGEEGSVIYGEAATIYQDDGRWLVDVRVSGTELWVSLDLEQWDLHVLVD